MVCLLQSSGEQAQRNDSTLSSFSFVPKVSEDGQHAVTIC